MINRNLKAVITDFDQTIFETSRVMENLKKGKVTSKLIRELTPNINLYEGWRTVFNTFSKHQIPFGIVSHNTKTTITQVLKEFDIKVDFLLTRYGKNFSWPNCKIIPKHILLEQALGEPALVGLKPSEIIYLGDQASDVEESTKFGCCSGACFWGTQEADLLENSNATFKLYEPKDLLKVLNLAS